MVTQTNTTRVANGQWGVETRGGEQGRRLNDERLFLLATLYLMTIGMGLVLGMIVVICEAFGLPSLVIMASLSSLLLWAAWECH